MEIALKKKPSWIVLFNFVFPREHVKKKLSAISKSMGRPKKVVKTICGVDIWPAEMTVPVIWWKSEMCKLLTSAGGEVFVWVTTKLEIRENIYKV